VGLEDGSNGPTVSLIMRAWEERAVKVCPSFLPHISSALAEEELCVRKRMTDGGLISMLYISRPT